jgi:hypothetical protein
MPGKRPGAFRVTAVANGELRQARGIELPEEMAECGALVPEESGPLLGVRLIGTAGPRFGHVVHGTQQASQLCRVYLAARHQNPNIWSNENPPAPSSSP